MAFPTTLDTLKDTWSGSEAPYGHANHHNSIATLLYAIQNKIGINSSADTNSLQYKIADLYSVKAGQKVSASIDTFVDSTTATKKMRFDISLLTASRVFKFPDRTNEFAVTATSDRTGNIDHVLRGDGTFGNPTTSVPSGAMMMWLTASAPTGYLLCDGTAVSRATYAGLYAVIGTTYGTGDGSTTFNLPNMKGRVPVGYDSTQTEFNTMGKTGGAKTHTLVTNEMPSHTHPTLNGNQGGGGSGVNIATNGGLYNVSMTESGLVGSRGGDQPHNNLQPYIAINFIIKT